MSAFFFGEPNQLLYGYYHPADFSQDKRAALLVCNGMPHEYMRSHRMLKQLANQLARAGISVLRFDYPGMGDSWGHSTDVAPQDWSDAIVEAMEELEGTSAAERLFILSVRAGALFVDNADLQDFAIQKHISIDPITDGEDYYGRLQATHGEMLIDPMRFIGTHHADYRNPAFPEFLGTEYSPDFINDLRQLKLLNTALLTPVLTHDSQSAVPIEAATRIDIDCQWDNGEALETQVVLPGLSEVLQKIL